MAIPLPASSWLVAARSVFFLRPPTCHLPMLPLLGYSRIAFFRLRLLRTAFPLIPCGAAGVAVAAAAPASYCLPFLFYLPAGGYSTFSPATRPYTATRHFFCRRATHGLPPATILRFAATLAAVYASMRVRRILAAPYIVKRGLLCCVYAWRRRDICAFVDVYRASTAAWLLARPAFSCRLCILPFLLLSCVYLCRQP